jgi:hypothetical protein
LLVDDDEAAGKEIRNSVNMLLLSNGIEFYILLSIKSIGWDGGCNCSAVDVKSVMSSSSKGGGTSKLFKLLKLAKFDS